MSQLNDLDNELVTIPHDAKAIAKAWGDKIRQLANNSKVEKETLELLVCCAYHRGRDYRRTGCRNLRLIPTRFS